MLSVGLNFNVIQPNTQHPHHALKTAGGSGGNCAFMANAFQMRFAITNGKTKLRSGTNQAATAQTLPRPSNNSGDSFSAAMNARRNHIKKGMATAANAAM